MNSYPLQLEIAGPIALWACADSMPNLVCSFHAFHRRLERGRWFYTPCLRWKEFVPDYVGPFRDGTAPCATENHVIPALLEMASG